VRRRVKPTSGVKAGGKKGERKKKKKIEAAGFEDSWSAVLAYLRRTKLRPQENPPKKIRKQGKETQVHDFTLRYKKKKKTVNLQAR